MRHVPEPSRPGRAGGGGGPVAGPGPAGAVGRPRPGLGLSGSGRRGHPAPVLVQRDASGWPHRIGRRCSTARCRGSAVQPGCLRARYSEPDKIAHGLTDAGRWRPFWTIDVSFATMLLLLGAVEEIRGLCSSGCGEGRPCAPSSPSPAECGPSGRWPRLARPKARSARIGLAGPAPAEDVVHRGGW